MSRFTPKNSLILFAALAIFAGILFFRHNAALDISSVSSGLRAQKSFEEHATDIIARCKNAKSRPSCYDDEIPKLMDSISMEDAFRVTQIVQAQDPAYQFCHVLGHRLSAREVQKNPDDWKNVVSRCPSGTCSNGCIHGGFQERFRKESFSPEEIDTIKPDLTDLCEARGEWHPTGLEQGSCYHALGHLTMYLTNADIKKSIALCKEVAVKKDGRDLSRLCFDGAFMQIFQPLEPEDFALIEGKVPDASGVSAFCGQFSGTQKGACLTESWPLFREEVMQPLGLVRFCARQDAEERDRCFISLAYILTVQFQFDTAKLKMFCGGLPEERQGICFSNVASRFIETDYRNISRAVTFCAGATYIPAKEQCFNELTIYSTYNFHPQSEEFLALCTALPVPWKTACLGKKSLQ
ncbi:MAG: Uncharacterized protein G01um101433_988 [Parcubacteria group bacterium Gr01-1014_33]|nr:MAG: Uncharacterized protein G01um101433_988 [Parcubacteria group bacterium Gr01-1014_33]